MNPITTTIEIEFNGSKFTIDLAKAEKHGLLVPVRDDVTDFQIGDIFGYKNDPSFFVVQTAWQKDSYSILGYLQSVRNYSNKQGVTKAEIIEYINHRKVNLLGNVNDVINEYFAKLKNKG